MSNVFKAYDIRGRYPDEIDVALAERIGYAAAAFVGARRAVVGRDVRRAAPAMEQAVARGLARVCLQVRLLGLSTTPYLTFATAGGGFDVGIMVTASHNPPEYIGFKLCRSDGSAIGETSGLKEIERLAREGPRGAPSGAISPLDLGEAYRRHLRSRLACVPEGRKIVVDTANGAVGPWFDRCFGDLPARWHRLFFEPDGAFPNHEPDPLKERNTRAASEAVRRERADFGVAFDGDGDRALFLDERGERIPGDLLTALLAREFLRAEPGARIVYDVRSSRAVREEIERAGGVPVRERVGHAFLKAAMRAHNAAFGGELSGHYYYRDHFFADSALMTFVFFCNAVLRRDRPVSEQVAGLRRYAKTGEINFRVPNPQTALASVERAFPEARTDHLDGLTVDAGRFWFNLRPSNTEPLLRLNLEAEDASLLEEVRGRLWGLLGQPI